MRDAVSRQRYPPHMRLVVILLLGLSAAACASSGPASLPAPPSVRATPESEPLSDNAVEWCASNPRAVSAAAFQLDLYTRQDTRPDIRLTAVDGTQFVQDLPSVLFLIADGTVEVTGDKGRVGQQVMTGWREVDPATYARSCLAAFYGP